MTEREVQAQLHPHTGQVDVSLFDDGALIEHVMRKSLIAAEALNLLSRAHKRMHTALKTVALEDNLQAAVAKNALEDVKAMLEFAGSITYDHAGPDY